MIHSRKLFAQSVKTIYWVLGWGSWINWFSHTPHQKLFLLSSMASKWQKLFHMTKKWIYFSHFHFYHNRRKRFRSLAHDISNSDGKEKIYDHWQQTSTTLADVIPDKIKFTLKITFMMELSRQYTLLGSQSKWAKDKPFLLIHSRHARNQGIITKEYQKGSKNSVSA